MGALFPWRASRARRALAAIAAAVIAGACSKGEPQQAGKSGNNPAPAASAVAPQPAPRAGDAVDTALRERLARQEAAARMFEKNVLEPPAPRAPEPPRPAPPAARPAEATPPPEPPRTASAARPAEPQKAVEAPRPAPPARPAEAPKSAEPPKPAEPAKAATPRVDLAAARPAAADATAARLVTRVDPDFPAEALRAGVDKGSVRARLTLDAAGNVTRVDVVEANPRRYFDRAVVRALTQWKFSEGAAGRVVDSEVEFRR